jgi:hypothetical protein
MVWGSPKQLLDGLLFYNMVRENDDEQGGSFANAVSGETDCFCFCFLSLKSMTQKE